MSFTVTLYQFSKRDNSTKRPGGGSSYSCELKDSCGVVFPTLVMRISNPTNYNYCRVSEFNRYYFISDWVYEAPNWVAHCTPDVLASWKNEIGGTSLYILRASGDSNGDITDTLYPTTANIEKISSTSDTPFKTSLSEGTYVVGIIGKNGSVGAATYYCFTQSQMSALCQFLFGEVSWMEIDDIGENLQKALINPFNYIASCFWFPFTISNQSGVASVDFGWWTIETGAGVLGTNASFTGLKEISIPKHPQAATRGKYLNLAPYSRYYLEFEPFGMFPLDTTAIIDADSVSCRYTVDLVTGSAILQVSGTDNRGNIIANYTAQLGVPIQLAQIATDYIHAGATIVAGAADTASALAKAGDPIAALTSGGTENVQALVDSISKAATAIDNATHAAAPQLITSGSNGGLSAFRISPAVHGQFFPVVDEDNSHYGRPLCEKRTPASLGGYVQVADGDISAPCTNSELQIIRKYLEGGFYYE